MESSRWWTVTEANDVLGWIGEHIETMRRLVEEARAATRHAGEVVRSNGHGALPADMGPIRELVEDLQGQGIILRDLDKGLVDFPARTPSGEPYLLCWVLGEPEVAWWHWPDAGFAGRTPLVQPPE